MNAIKTFLSLLKQTFDEWNADNVPRLAAALAYYTAFSIAPLLIVVIAIVGALFGEQATRDQVASSLQGSIGPEAAQLVQDLIVSASQPREGLVSTILSVVAVLFGALGIFEQLQSTLNTIWGTTPGARPGGIVGFILTKLLSFGMLLVGGFLLLVSLVLTAVLTGLQGYFEQLFPGAGGLFQVLNFGLALAITTALFAMIYKYLPETRIEWRDVLVGAFFTALLFSLGRILLALYLTRSSPASAYGAAGSLVLVLLWVFYSAQIILFGAEFTQVYARRHGSHNDAPAPQKTSGSEKAIMPPVIAPAPQNAPARTARRLRVVEVLITVALVALTQIANLLGGRRDRRT